MALLQTEFKPPVYKAGQFNEFGIKVVRQLMWHDHYCIFLCERGVGYQASGEVLARSHELLEKFNYLVGRIDAMLDGSAAARLREQLGIVLSDGFDLAAEDSTPSEALFKAVEAQIDAECTTKAKMIYVSVAGGLLTITILLALLVHSSGVTPISKLFIFGAASGATGAFLSLLIRLNKLDLQTEATSRSTHNINGLIRITFGILAAAVTLLAIKGNVFLGYLNGNIFGTLFACVAAGFIEYLVPEMLNKFATDGNKANTNASGAAQ